jgi:hypothetical protein
MSTEGGSRSVTQLSQTTPITGLIKLARQSLSSLMITDLDTVISDGNDGNDISDARYSKAVFLPIGCPIARARLTATSQVQITLMPTAVKFSLPNGI